MLILAKSDLCIKSSNVIKLDTNIEGSSLFVSRNTYDQAVVLSDLFDGDGGITSIISKVSSDTNCARYIDYVEFLEENLPKPVSILAAFLCMTRPEVKFEQDVEYLLAYLNELSNMVDFKKCTRVDKKILNGLHVGASAQETYEVLKQNVILANLINVSDNSDDGEEQEPVRYYHDETKIDLIKYFDILKSEGLHAIVSTDPIQTGGTTMVSGPTQPVEQVPELPEEVEVDEEDLESIFNAIGDIFDNMGSDEFNEEEVESAKEFKEEEVEEATTFEQEEQEVEEIQESEPERELTPQELKDLEFRRLMEKMGGK